MNTHDILIKQKVELAIKEHKLVRFDYVKADLELTKDRLVEPVILLPQEGEPNRFAGNDFVKQEQRQFSFSGVQNLKVLEYTEAQNK